MTVYVDDARFPATIARTQSRWSHLLADTHDELVAFADRLGLKPEWIKKAGLPTEHYLVADIKRDGALRMGAIPMKSSEVLALVVAKRSEGTFDLAVYRATGGTMTALPV
jgi:hypothetical protein